MCLEEELLNLEERWIEAVQQHDLDTLTELLSDNFTVTSWASGGEVLTRPEYLAEVPAVRLRSYTFHTCAVLVFGDAAVVKCTLDWDAKVKGKPWRSEFLISDFWVKSEGRWRAASRHVSLPFRPFVGEPASHSVWTGASAL